MTNELQKVPQNNDGGRAHLPAVPSPDPIVPSMKQRFSYFAWTVVPSTVALAAMGGPIGGDIAIALAAGATAAYFSGEIHGVIGPGLRMVGQAWDAIHKHEAEPPGRVRHPALDLHWWLGSGPRQAQEQAYVDVEAEEEDMAGRTQEPGQPELSAVALPQASYEYLQLSPTWQPHADETLSKRTGLFGIPGSGKSNCIAVFIEELGRLNEIGAPFVLADTEDEYDALCNETYLMRPYKAHAGNVTPDNAHAFGRDVLEYGLQVVLNLQSYDSDDEAALVMIELIRGLREWEEEHANSERVSCVFILDEAATWLPQRENESSLSKEKDEHKMTLLARLQQTFFRTVRKGRKRGIGFMFATQRPADLDKRCISCDRLILFKQTLPNDLEVYKRMGVESDEAMALSPGEALILSHTGECELHQFRHRYSPDNSRSPGLASLKKRSQQWQSTPTKSRHPVQRLEEETFTGTFTQPLSREQEALSHAQNASLAPRESLCESPRERVRESLRESPQESDIDAILEAVATLESEQKPLTLNAIAKLAGMTWRQWDEIEQVVTRAGFNLVIGKGRPAKEE